MKAKIIFILTLFVSMLNATTLQTVKNIYTPQENIVITVDGMQGSDTDWIGIYPVDANNDWGNIVRWGWTGGIVNGDVELAGIPEGEYEARAFFENSFNLEATIAFSVEGNANAPTVTTNKESYVEDEQMTVNFSGMSANAGDWIGLYSVNAPNDWDNLLAWKYTNGSADGSVSFNKNLPAGNYSARAFFNDSYNLEASHDFSVENGADGVTLTLNKNTYADNELVYVNFDNMQGNNTDWIGIYPADASYEFANVIDWVYTDGLVSGEISLGGFPANTELRGSTPMPGLTAGDYEVRAFFNNTLQEEKTVSFTVVEEAVTSIFYEKADGGISANWIHVSGIYPPSYIAQGMVRLKANWINPTTNTSEYSLSFDAENTTDKVLELDVGGAGRWTPHFNVGVVVSTTNGNRRMLWDSFLNHYNVSANKNGTVLSFPTYIELQNNTANNQQHFRVNIDKYLKILEPTNKLIHVKYFFATGGDLDNIRLSSH